MAEREGFEPPVRQAHSGFQDRHIRPLCHLSRPHPPGATGTDPTIPVGPRSPPAHQSEPTGRRRRGRTLCLEVEHYEHCYRSWVDYAEEYLIKSPGAWVHELDRDNEPSTRTWAGHPDVYHALQATLMARLPVWPAIGQALAEGRLDEPNSLLPARASKPHRRGFFGRS